MQGKLSDFSTLCYIKISYFSSFPVQLFLFVRVRQLKHRRRWNKEMENEECLYFANLFFSWQSDFYSQTTPIIVLSQVLECCLLKTERSFIASLLKNVQQFIAFYLVKRYIISLMSLILLKLL